jgi:glycosyltransferase involved in cell wall biosynthesis
MKNYVTISKELNKEKFRIVALLAIRNEELYLEKCLEHLYQQGIEVCIIDNDSTDNSLNIALQFLGRGVFRIERQPYKGYFDLCEQLTYKEKLASEIHADWFIHCDADEIRQAPAHYSNLYQGILAVSIAGYNAINFDEFVFIPLGENETHENKDFTDSMRHYYFFEPYPLRRVNAWKKLNSPIDLVNSGGHSVAFLDRKIFPEHFILRHYIGLSASHLDSKYSKRIFSETEINDFGWHGWRARFSNYRLSFPTVENLKLYLGDGKWDKTDPKIEHLFVKEIKDVK